MLARLLAQVLRPTSHGFVALHAAQRGSFGNAQYHRQAVATPRARPGICNVVEEVGLYAHLIGCKHDVGFACELKLRSVSLG
jgi:hypothetical protein